MSVSKVMRSIAAEKPDTSVSALFAAYVEQLAATEPESERLKRQERERRTLIQNFSASDRLSRNELHNRLT